MGWGSHCPDCGKTDCKWVHGPVCQGSLPSFIEEHATLKAENERLIRLLDKAVVGLPAAEARAEKAEQERDEARLQVLKLCDDVNIGLWHEEAEQATPSPDDIWRMCVESRERGDNAEARAEAAERALAERAGGVKGDAVSVIDTLIESLSEGLMTDAGLTKADRDAMKHQITALEIAKDGISALTTEPAAPQEAPALRQVGWAYQDKKWDADRWHVCGWEKPREHEGRQVKPIYIAEPAAPEGRQEAHDFSSDPARSSRCFACGEWYDHPTHSRPAEQAVTEAMVEAGARAVAQAWGENWECCCAERRGLDCDCGDAMTDERDGYDERLSREDCRMAARAALKAAMEAGR